MKAPVAAIYAGTCPSCRSSTYFISDRKDFEKHRALYPDAPVTLHPGVDVHGWTAAREAIVGGKHVVVTRRDVLANRVYPLKCPKCSTVYVVRLDIKNLSELENYEKNVRPYHEPSPQWPPVDPKWGFVSQTVAAFCEDVKATRNPMMRSFVVRALRAAGWDFVPLRDVDVSTPFQ